MKLNMFEGARRIAVVLGVLWVAGCIGYAVLNEPHARMVFTIADIGEPPRQAGDCGPDDAGRWIAPAEGIPIGVTLCFTAHRANDGRLLVPYPSEGVSVRMPDGTIIDGVPEGLSKAEMEARLKAGGYDIAKLLAPAQSASGASSPGRFRMFALGERWSGNVSAYVDGAVAGFKFPSAAVAEAKQRVWDARMAQWKLTLQVMLGVLLAGWLLCTTVGWVMRGFLGIPRGKDARPA